MDIVEWSDGGVGWRYGTMVPTAKGPMMMERRGRKKLNRIGKLCRWVAIYVGKWIYHHEPVQVRDSIVGKACFIKSHVH